MAILSFLFGFVGNTKYIADDITLINTSYYGMERNPMYSFALQKQDENWLFSASCYVQGQDNHYASFDSFPIPTEDAEEFLKIIDEENEINHLYKYRNRPRILSASDAPMRSS